MVTTYMDQETIPTNGKAEFDPSKYLTKVGSADYLEVKWRLVWMRDMYPDAQVETEQIKVIPPGVDPEGVKVGWAMFRARIRIPSTGASADGHGSESVEDFRDYIEKAETKAIGRALAALGFGTQFSGREWEHGGIVDSPVQPPRQQPQVQRQQPPQGQQPQQQPPPQGSPQVNQGSPRMLSQRQGAFIEGLIQNVAHENPADFRDRIAQLTAEQASAWIKQLQNNELPWLNEVMSPKS